MAFFIEISSLCYEDGMQNIKPKTLANTRKIPQVLAMKDLRDWSEW
jgi:hypothetical protein